MTKEDRFVMSHNPYAIDMLSLESHWIPTVIGGVETGGVYKSEINSLWYRRRSGILYVCIGVLWNHSKVRPESSIEFLESHSDGRYGGYPYGRWDGNNYWSPERPDEVQVGMQLSTLKPALENFPSIPEGYDGWWVFE